MSKPPTRLAVGIAWYRPEDWELLRQLCPDRDKMHARYEDWRAGAMRAEQAMQNDDYVVLRVVIDPDELTGWCTLSSSGRRNTCVERVAMRTGRRRSDRALRAVLQWSPGRPGVAQRENRRRFWMAIASGR